MHSLAARCSKSPEGVSAQHQGWHDICLNVTTTSGATWGRGAGSNSTGSWEGTPTAPAAAPLA